MFLAALKNLPKELYEAADIDGSGKIAKFIHVTLPQISPIIFFTLIMQTIQALQNFTSLGNESVGITMMVSNSLVAVMALVVVILVIRRECKKSKISFFGK